MSFVSALKTSLASSYRLKSLAHYGWDCKRLLTLRLFFGNPLPYDPRTTSGETRTVGIPRNGSCGWPRKTARGVTTVSPGPWPIWAMRSAIKPWAIFSSAEVCQSLQIVSKPRLGASSSAATGRCCGPRIFSPLRFGPLAAWPRSMSYSSSSSTRVKSISPALACSRLPDINPIWRE